MRGILVVPVAVFGFLSVGGLGQVYDMSSLSSDHPQKARKKEPMHL